MSLYVLATRVASASLRTPETLSVIERHVMNRVREECSDVRWLYDLAVCGPYDYLDVFDAPTLESAMRVSVLVRTYGHAHAELWPAVGWSDFKKLLSGIPRGDETRSPEEIEGD
jgi:hypothetical protein